MLRNLWLWTPAVAWALATSVWAQPAPFNPSDWRTRPSDAEVLGAWPKTASPDLGSGDVVLDCTVGPQGTPADCKVAAEDPAGQGLGDAALGLAGRFQWKASSGPQGRVALLIGLHAPGFQAASWLRRPRPEDLMNVWPQAALGRQLGGVAVLRCQANQQGSLFDCTVEAEKPAGLGFGDAAITLTPQLLLHPATLNGKPIVSTVRLPINFAGLPGGDANETGSHVRPRNDEFFADAVIDAAIAWPEAPSYADVAAAYPAAARESRAGGRVALDCVFNRQGRFAQCDGLREEPSGKGFGAAARALTRKFRGPTMLDDGTPIAGVHVQLPISFTPEMLGPTAPAVATPKWTALPTGDVMADAYPAAARKAAIPTGRAVFLCDVQPEGKLACATEAEDPGGYGFGEAGLKIIPYFRMATWTIEGLPVIGGKVRVPLRFVDDAAPASADAPPKAP